MLDLSLRLDEEISPKCVPRMQNNFIYHPKVENTLEQEPRGMTNTWPKDVFPFVNQKSFDVLDFRTHLDFCWNLRSKLLI